MLSESVVSTDTASESAYYWEHGYVVVRGVVPHSLIARLLELYARDIVPSRYPFYRQNTDLYESNKITDKGYVRQSFLDIHDYARFPEFSEAARNIFCSEELLAALRRVTGSPVFRLMQTMLFDLNTATPGHQDWYYLDSVPHGNLTAAWIALEDIEEQAGRFYVVPGSQNLDFGAKQAGLTHADWLKKIRGHIDEHRQEVSAPALRKGDVLFWNSRTIHGSLPTLDERFSRKSLTAHYLPSQYEFGNLFTVKSNLRYKNYKGVDYYRNQPDYSLWSWFKYSVKNMAYNNPMLRETIRGVRDRLNGTRGRAS